MSRPLQVLVCTALGMGALATASAEPPHEHPGPEAHGGPPPHTQGPHGEPHPGPRGYDRVTEPHGWNNRPANVDRDAYRHNFQAARAFHVGPYHRPTGWAPHHWAYGQTLPRAYWAAPYLIADYWLFALEVPPAGYEWVRDDADALLVNTATGEILQVEYGVFG
jgi:Ni/Co efflux regulator RcnB